uniref:SRCR domain-containing protein n=1 Tax=Pundamilia nyererei TaxID=303518 RepID=A0A3B4FCR8_9CICH
PSGFHTFSQCYLCFIYFIGHVRLVNGTRCNGRVEIYHEAQWKRVCSDLGKQAAQVVCQEAGCGDPPTQTETLYFGDARALPAIKTICSGNETSVSQCSVLKVNESLTLLESAISEKTYSQPIRLVNGTNRCSGRVEIYYSSQWGTVCDDRWGMQEATVACREMNCGNALSVKYKAYSGRGQDQIWLDKMECTGHEMFLADCPHKGFGVYDCNHSEYAGLVCSETVRLINGTDSCSGRVEVFHDGRWGKLCSNNWGLKEAAVLCKELNCGDPKNSKDIFYFGDSSLQGFTSRCSDNVNSISQLAGVFCTGKKNMEMQSAETEEAPSMSDKTFLPLKMPHPDEQNQPFGIYLPRLLSMNQDASI